jgi:S1-C subfamily serine protease
MKRLIGFLNIALRLVLTIAIVWVTMFNVSVVKRIYNTQSVLTAQMDMITNYQQSMYRQIAQSIVYDKALTEAFSNFVKNEATQEEVMSAIVDYVTKMKEYVNEKFKESDIKNNIADEKLRKEFEEISKLTLDKAQIVKALEEFITNRVKYNILQYTVLIENDTDGTMGSGVTIKYNDAYYILSAGHLITTEQDAVYLSENGQRICKLKVLKVDHEIDLLLLQPEDPDMTPRYATEIATTEPTKLDDLWVCGNPAGVEDLLSKGQLMGYQGTVMYIQDSCFFGSSGGGVYNTKGQLVGIISHLRSVDPNPLEIIRPEMPIFVADGIVRLKTISKFLERK